MLQRLLISAILVFLYLRVNSQVNNNIMTSRHSLLQNTASKNYELGMDALDRGKYELSIQFFDASLYKNNYDIQVYQSRAIAKEHLGLKMEALTDYNIVLGIDSLNSEALLARGMLLYQLNFLKKSIQDFQQFLKVPKGSTNSVIYRSSLFASATDKIMTAQSINSEIFNYIGMAHSGLNQYKKAIYYFDSAISINAFAPDYFINRGLAKTKQNRNKEAIVDFEKALKIDPHNSLARFNLGVIASKTGNHNQAISTYDEAILHDSTLTYAYTERGNAKFKNNHFSAALKDYNKVVEINPNDPENWFNKALANEKLHYLTAAYDDYSKVIDLKPDHERAYLGRGNVLSRLKKYKEAILNYDLALFYYPKYGIALYNRGIAHYNNGNTPNACLDLQEAITFNITAAQSAYLKICK